MFSFVSAVKKATVKKNNKKLKDNEVLNWYVCSQKCKLGIGLNVCLYCLLIVLNDYRHISCRMTSTFVGNDSDKNAKGIKKKKKTIINNENALSQNKLKLTGDIISFVNTSKFSKRNNETSTVRE